MGKKKSNFFYSKFLHSYEGQGSEVDRLYPALEVRRYLSASLAQASEIPMSLPMSLPMSISRNHKISSALRQQSATHFDSESGIWTPPPVGQNDHELDHEDLDNIDNIEDIFTLSGSSSGSSTRPDPTESNEFNLDTDQDFDEESLYSDALSRKQSLVRFLVCMSFFKRNTHTYMPQCDFIFLENLSHKLLGGFGRNSR